MILEKDLLRLWRSFSSKWNKNLKSFKLLKINTSLRSTGNSQSKYI